MIAYKGAIGFSEGLALAVPTGQSFVAPWLTALHIITLFKIIAQIPLPALSQWLSSWREAG